MARLITLPLELLEVASSSEPCTPKKRIRGYRFGMPDPKDHERDYFDDSEFNLSYEKIRRFGLEQNILPLAYNQFNILHFSTPREVAYFLYLMRHLSPSHPRVIMKELFLAIREEDLHLLTLSRAQATELVDFASELGLSVSPPGSWVLHEFLTGGTLDPGILTHWHIDQKKETRNRAGCGILVAMLFQYIRHKVEYMSLRVEPYILHHVQGYINDNTVATGNADDGQYENNKRFPQIKLFAWRRSYPWPPLLIPGENGTDEYYKFQLDKVFGFVAWARISKVDIYQNNHSSLSRHNGYGGAELLGNCITNLNLRDAFISPHDLAPLVARLPHLVHFKLKIDHNVVEPDGDIRLHEPLPSQVILCLQPLAHKLLSLGLVIDGTNGVACPDKDLIYKLTSFTSLRKLRIGTWCFTSSLLDNLPPSITDLNITGPANEIGKVLAPRFKDPTVWQSRLRELDGHFWLPASGDESLRFRMQ